MLCIHGGLILVLRGLSIFTALRVSCGSRKEVLECSVEGFGFSEIFLVGFSLRAQTPPK